MNEHKKDLHWWIIFGGALIVTLGIGILLGWGFESRARGDLEAELGAHQTRIAAYQRDIDTITGKLGEAEESFEGARDIIIGLRGQVESERRTNGLLLDGISAAQQSFGTIAARANSAIGYVDASLNLFEENEDRNNSPGLDSID